MQDHVGRIKAGTTDAARTLDIERHLRRRETAKNGVVAAQLIFGLPALFFGPIVIGSIYWVLGCLWDMDVRWIWVFVGSFLILNPLLFWMEWRSGGAYYTTAVLSTHSKSDGSQTVLTSLAGLTDLGVGINFIKHPRDQAIGITELSLWGPRQTLEAFRTLRIIRELAAVDRKRAAGVLLSLQTCDHADLSTLIPGGDAEAVAVAAYLAWYDWIGVSADKSRVWIESDSRAVLNR